MTRFEPESSGSEAIALATVPSVLKVSTKKFYNANTNSNYFKVPSANFMLLVDTSSHL